MKKLDEIMELMADEMADFKNALIKLEALSKELNDMSIPISTTAIDKNLKDFLRNQKEANNEKEELLKGITTQLKQSSLIPKYILLLFGSCLLIMLIMFGYFIYSDKIEEAQRFEIYRAVSESELESYQFYFSENSKIKEVYCKWLEQSYK
ncbi:hypothetical protein C7S20_04510 [Christiangramia fulva]|uniref:Uncharacterized protein n=1 Tax=Christiangramia fulva TaxID=2126553 RepID=A0A2R3Z2V4_9FLAO|nr:DUF6730 family protein [Christiangramia fulva]AVR44585.1 hypothetical protein C7S20_04510 [Christiangramia fulva]